jgi:chromosome segregation ATPase
VPRPPAFPSAASFSSRIATQIQDREDQQTAINEDQARLRENLKALKGGAEERELIQRYTHQLNTEEDTLDRLKKELGHLDVQQESAQQELKKTIDDLALTVDL